MAEQCSYIGALRGICKGLTRENNTTCIKAEKEVWENRTITPSPEPASIVVSNIFTPFTHDMYLTEATLSIKNTLRTF